MKDSERCTIMASRGRKRKKEISLFDTEESKQENQYVDYPKKSVLEQSLIWEYKNPQNKRVEIYTYPLSRDAAIRHWKHQVSLGDNQSAASFLSRIKNNSHKLDKERQIYDQFPRHKNLIDELLFSASFLCSMKNSARRTGSHYATSVTSLVRFFTSCFENVEQLNNIDTQKQTVLYNELTKTDNKYFNHASKTYSKNILIDALERNQLQADPLKQKIKGHSHSGKETRLDYPQEVAIQLLAIAASETNKIMYEYNEYQSWKNLYQDKAFDSIENIAKAYMTIPESFLNKKSKTGITNSISAYQRSYDNLCMKIHGISLSNMSHDECLALAESGHNIDALDDHFTMAWFLDDIQHNFPFNVKSKATTDIHMSKYTRWNLEMSLRHYLNSRGKARKKDFWATYQDVFSRKYPTAEKLIPFILFWMLQTGSNPEAIVNMKRKEKGLDGTIEIGEISPLGDTPVIKSFKNRGSKDYYWFALNLHEKGGLYTHFIFLKSFLQILWQEDDKISNKKELWPFWVYYSPMKENKVINLSWSTLKLQLNNFIKEHQVILPNGDILQTLEPSRFRNTFITMADLTGATIEEIQEWIRHKDFDTRFKFYDNSPDQRSRNFRAVHAIQEDIIENARNFKGKIDSGSLDVSINNKEVNATYTCGCTNPQKPSYSGAQKIPQDNICIDWDMCLFCPNSRVFSAHLPRICARILHYESHRKKMTTEEWENNFGAKHVVAHDALKKWILDGGTEEDINNAWEVAKSGNVILPPIFPSGHIKRSDGAINVA